MTPTVSPTQLLEEIIAVCCVGLVPMATSSPGVGKSSIFRQFADAYNLKFIDCRLSTMAPEDLTGLPMRDGNKAIFAPFDFFPVEGDEIPEGYDGWFILFDEITSATKPMQAAAYRIILDKLVGNQKLHPNVLMGAAGNKTTDKAVVHQMSTALQSRLVHYELVVSVDDFTDHAVKQGYDYRITAFVNYLPSSLMDFRPDHHDKTFACPRTWEFLSRMIKDKEVSHKIFPRVAGTIGSGMATEFISFAQEFDRLPKYSDIVASPVSIPVPSESSTKYATLSMLLENTKIDDLSRIFEYIGKFSSEMQILYLRGLATRHPELPSNNSTFKAFARDRMRYMIAA